jgi:hypothetical protein
MDLHEDLKSLEECAGSARVRHFVTTPNQNPEQIARDQIDKHLVESGWIVQDKKTIDFSAGLGIVDTQMRKV